MLKVIACFCLCCFFYTVRAQRSSSAAPGEDVTMGKVRLHFSLDAGGEPVYTVSYGDKPVILPSRLGFVLAEDSTFYKGFALVGVERKSFDSFWQPVWGEVREIRDHYEQLTVHLKSDGRPSQGGA